MLPQVLNFAAANQNQMINHKLAFELSVTRMIQVTERHTDAKMSKKFLSRSMFCGMMLFHPTSPEICFIIHILSPDCGQISRHKAALLPI